jgi:hypothetical protein
MPEQSTDPVLKYQEALQAYREAAEAIHKTLSAARTLTDVLSRETWHTLKVLPDGGFEVEGEVEDQPAGRVQGPARRLDDNIEGWPSLQDLTRLFQQLQTAWKQMQDEWERVTADKRCIGLDDPQTFGSRVARPEEQTPRKPAVRP